MLKPLQQQSGSKMDKILRSTYALTSDPLIQFAVYFSALVHDVEHPGVSNSTLAEEGDPRADRFEQKSCAEQNSIVVAWEVFMSKQYDDLRKLMFVDSLQLERFRQLIMNAVMATDVFDKDLKSFREDRWYKAFPRSDVSQISTDTTGASDSLDEEGNLHATIVIEHIIIQASDVIHTMQHCTVYQTWNQRLFAEARNAYKAGRTNKDPAEGWYKGELWFFDNDVIPLAQKLKECGVFGVSCDEVLNHARDNRLEWEQRGVEIVQQWTDRNVEVISC